MLCSWVIPVLDCIHIQSKADPLYVVGRGKLEDVSVAAMQQDAELIIFDHNLAPNQARAIGDITEAKIIDRTQLILDIFAQRAHSVDGKLQVELAQLKYRMPRLTHLDGGLSRLVGGIGGRGPGETKLEIDRRRARERITRLKQEGCEDLSALKPYEEQVAWARAHPEDLECLHAVFSKQTI